MIADNQGAFVGTVKYYLSDSQKLMRELSPRAEAIAPVAEGMGVVMLGITGGVAFAGRVGAVEAYAIYRLTQVATALKAAQEAWLRIPYAQREAAMRWLSQIKQGRPPSGPPPPGSAEALKAYRELAIQVINAGRDTVRTQQVRVEAIDRFMR